MVSLLIKSIQPVSATHLAITYEVKSEIQDFELKIVTPLQTDLNAAEQHARSRLEQFARDLCGACQNNPLIEQLAAAQKRHHP